MRPMLDHGLLSPSGRTSKRARAAALARETARCFGGEHLITTEDLRREHLAAMNTPASIAARNRSHAKFLRGLADKGMKPRAYNREAERLEAEAAELEAQGAES